MNQSATTLHQCAAEGDLARLDRLCQRGADIDALDGEHLTPLHRAVRSGAWGDPLCP